MADRQLERGCFLASRGLYIYVARASRDDLITRQKPELPVFQCQCISLGCPQFTSSRVTLGCILGLPGNTDSSANDGKCCGALSCFIHEMLTSLFIICQPIRIATIFSGNASHKNVLTFQNLARAAKKSPRNLGAAREHRLAQQRQPRQQETEGQRKAR